MDKERTYGELYMDNVLLQQENRQLKEVIETLKKTNKLLIKQKYQIERDLDNEANKINKAIEYIEFVGMEETFDKVLIDMLKEND